MAARQLDCHIFMLDDYMIRAADTAYKAFVQSFDEFLIGKYPNIWIYGEDIISVYVRKGKRHINGGWFACLDIGTITISEQYQGNGIGTKVIDHIHRRHSLRATLVESILNDRLYDRLKREHWNDVKNSVPHSVFKLKPLKHGDRL